MNSRVLAVLGGSSLDAERMRNVAESATTVIAVDAGFRHLEAVGRTPDFLLGDFDSVALSQVPSSVQQVALLDQTHTDFHKALDWCALQRFTKIHVACSEGDLPDHQLQNLLTAATSQLDVWFVFQRGMGRIIRSRLGVTTYTSLPKMRVSLVPLTHCSSVEFHGVKWPLSSAELVPLGSTSISNEASGSEISVGLDSGSALLFWETPDVIWE